MLCDARHDTLWHGAETTPAVLAHDSTTGCERKAKPTLARPGVPGRASVREPSQHVSQLPDVSTATTHGSAEPRLVPAPGQPGKPAHRTDAAPAPPHCASASGWVRASSDPTGSKKMVLATVAAEGIWALLPGAWPCSRLAPRAWARKRKLARPSLEGRSVVPPGRWWQLAQPRVFLMPSPVPGRRLRHSRRLPSCLPEAASWIQNPGAGFTQRGSGRTAGRVRLGVSVVVSSNDVLRTPPQASPPSSAPQAPGLSSVDGHHVSGDSPLPEQRWKDHKRFRCRRNRSGGTQLEQKQEERQSADGNWYRILEKL